MRPFRSTCLLEMRRDVAEERVGLGAPGALLSVEAEGALFGRAERGRVAETRVARGGRGAGDSRRGGGGGGGPCGSAAAAALRLCGAAATAALPLGGGGGARPGADVEIRILLPLLRGPALLGRSFRLLIIVAVLLLLVIIGLRRGLIDRRTGGGRLAPGRPAGGAFRIRGRGSRRRRRAAAVGAWARRRSCCAGGGGGFATGRCAGGSSMRWGPSPPPARLPLRRRGRRGQGGRRHVLWRRRHSPPRCARSSAVCGGRRRLAAQLNARQRASGHTVRSRAFQHRSTHPPRAAPASQRIFSREQAARWIQENLLMERVQQAELLAFARARLCSLSQ